jgi:metal-responsive CopG/Arc/MetJ family transcriptional regulator
MSDYSELDFIIDSEKKRINVDLPIRLLKRLDEIIYQQDINSRKQLIELLVIKFVMSHNDLKKL